MLVVYLKSVVWLWALALQVAVAWFLMSGAEERWKKAKKRHTFRTLLWAGGSVFFILSALSQVGALLWAMEQ